MDINFFEDHGFIYLKHDLMVDYINPKKIDFIRLYDVDGKYRLNIMFGKEHGIDITGEENILKQVVEFISRYI